MGIENPVHLLFIAAVALVVLGPRRLPDLAKALGHGIREFRDAMSSGEEGEEPPPPVAATAEAPPPAAAQGESPTQAAPGAPAQAATAQSGPDVSSGEG
jgi:sec-independent protein translocase protein TatA